MKKLFTETEIRNIEAALVEAEKGSDGEIVPIFSKISGKYDDARYILASLISIVVMMITLDLTTSKLIIFLSFILPFILIINLATFFPELCLPFISKKEMQDEVNRRASEYFYSYNLGSSKHGSGLLIYVSCFERMAVIKTDLRSNKVIHNQHLQNVCNLIVVGMKEKKIAANLVAAILQYGLILKETFPNNSADNPNELPNKLILIG
jgi:putative membrane protein